MDIRRQDDIPPSNRRIEYKYDPFPAELIPPIGSNYLMHTYQHPEDADLNAFSLSRFPKRINGRLQLGPNGVAKVGWGIHLAEGLSLKKIFAAGAIVLLASIVFGITWAVLRSDIQGGFCVGAFVMTVLAWGTGCIFAFNP